MQTTTGMTHASTADLAALVALNGDYVRAVRYSDVRRFDEILAEDFLCSLPGWFAHQSGGVSAACR